MVMERRFPGKIPEFASPVGPPGGGSPSPAATPAHGGIPVNAALPMQAQGGGMPAAALGQALSAPQGVANYQRGIGRPPGMPGGGPMGGGPMGGQPGMERFAALWEAIQRMRERMGLPAQP